MESKDSCITDPKPKKTSLLCMSNISNIHMKIIVWEIRNCEIQNVCCHFQRRIHSMKSDSISFSVFSSQYSVFNIVQNNSHLILYKQLKCYVNIHLHFKLFHETHLNAYNILTRKKVVDKWQQIKIDRNHKISER